MVIHKILIPIDFSDNSKNALKYGMEVARKTNATLILLHAYRLLGSQINSVRTSELSLKETLDKSPRENFLAIERKFLKNSGLNYEFQIQIGFVETVIKLITQTQPIDMVIMGTRGENRAGNFLGSTTARVIKEVNCPVLAIPSGVRFRDISNMLFAGAIGQSNAQGIIGVLSTMAGLFEAKIHWIDFHPEADQLKIKNLNVHKYLHHSTKSKKAFPVQGINRYIKSNHIDLLVVFPGTSDVVETIFQKKTLSSSQIPFLAVH